MVEPSMVHIELAVRSQPTDFVGIGLVLNSCKPGLEQEHILVYMLALHVCMLVYRTVKRI